MRSASCLPLVEAAVALRHALEGSAVHLVGALADGREADREDGVLDALGGLRAVGKDAEAAERLPEERQLLAAEEFLSDQLTVPHNRVGAKVVHVRRLLLGRG